MNKNSKDLVVKMVEKLFPRIERDGLTLAPGRFREDLNLDSLDMVNLQLAIEERLNYRFDPLEDNLAEVFESIESLSNFLENVGLTE